LGNDSAVPSIAYFVNEIKSAYEEGRNEANAPAATVA
jgi:hypothetical protein